MLPRSIQMHIMKETEDDAFWERLLKVRGSCGRVLFAVGRVRVASSSPRYAFALKEMRNRNLKVDHVSCLTRCDGVSILLGVVARRMLLSHRLKSLSCLFVVHRRVDLVAV